MKSTGVVRRIDELGRIVIPKEIRRHLGIREGENLEIFVEQDQIILKKYSKVFEYSEFSQKLCDLIPDSLDYNVLVTDRDKVISHSSNLKKELNGKTLDDKYLNFIRERESYESENQESFQIGENMIEGYLCIQPIISSIDCLGLIIFIKSHKFLKEEKQFAKFVAQMIANKIDIL